MKRGLRTGFTLIETALAILAIGLALVGIFGLGRHGLEATHEMGNDQKCAQLAGAIFETLREYNTRFVNESRTNSLNPSTAWVNYWAKDADKIPFPPVAGMCTNETLRLDCSGGMVPAFDRDNISLLDWNPYYQLSLSMQGESEDSTVPAGPNELVVLLVIYPDGTTYSSDIRSFTTTLSNPGGLQ
jgi:hypothetical protein